MPGKAQNAVNAGRAFGRRGGLNRPEREGEPRVRRRRPLWRRFIRMLLLTGLALAAAVAALALLFLVVTPPSTLMLGRWLTGRSVERIAVPLSGISPELGLAVLASEDQRFCLHGGVDWGALQEVMDDADSPHRGASTISMQTAKNVFLWPGRSYLRKAIEIPLAGILDALWGKRRTLEIYLNVAEWGDGVFGAEAAARRWFGRSAKDLTRQQAALLAVSLPNPIRRKAGRPSPRLRALAGRLSARMYGMASLAECIR